ncbi:MAG: hypothetical protein AAB564_01615 [Patescibacteria group bacterium]
MFLSKSKTKLLLALDVNASSVRAVVFKARKNGKPEIIRIFKNTAAILPEASFPVLLKKIKRNLAEIFKEVRKSALSFSVASRYLNSAKIDGVFVSLSSPWYFAQPKIIGIKKQEDFELTEEILNQQLEMGIRSVKEKLGENFYISKDEFTVLESCFFKSLLNGYRVSDLKNKKIKTAELYAYISVALLDLIKEIKRMAGENLDVDNVHFHSSSFILFEKMRETFGREESFLIIDVGEEITETMIVKNGFIKEISSFSKGGNFIVRRMASSLKIAPEEASSYLKMYNRNELIEDLKLKVENLLKEAFFEWKKSLKEILDNFYRFEGPLPERIFVFSAAPFPERFAAAASFSELSDIFAGGVPPAVSAFMPAAFGNEFLKESAFKDQKEIVVSFLTLFFNRHVWQTS